MQDVDSDISCVQDFLGKWIADCVVGVGGSEMSGDIEEDEGKVRAQEGQMGGTVEKERSLKIKT